MLVEKLTDWWRARDLIGEALGLALDVGHLLVTGEDEPAEAIAAHAHELTKVTVEDMRRREHVHLPFGQGDLDLPATLQALHAIGWRGLVCVELSRDSHRAPEMVAAAQASRPAVTSSATSTRWSA
jgi:D-psicose/D-tagatose/L-ribulose 3-epimerase